MLILLSGFLKASPGISNNNPRSYMICYTTVQQRYNKERECLLPPFPGNINLRNSIKGIGFKNVRRM